MYGNCVSQNGIGAWGGRPLHKYSGQEGAVEEESNVQQIFYFIANNLQ
jgi:hypothetical protein